jgi:hypothetical protein
VADEVSLSTHAQLVSNTLRNRGGAGNILVTAAAGLQIIDTSDGQTGIFAQGGAAGGNIIMTITPRAN